MFAGGVYASFTITSILTWDSPHLMEISCCPSDLILSLKIRRLSKVTSYSCSFSTISSLVTEPKVVVVSGMAARTNSSGPGNADSSANSFRAAVSCRLIPMLGSTIYTMNSELLTQLQGCSMSPFAHDLIILFANVPFELLAQ